MNQSTKITLNDGNQIPCIGLGVWRSGDKTKEAVLAGLKTGYRHIDNAAVYGNEEAVGEAIKESCIPREEIFITTKVWNDDMRAHSVREALETSLKKLQIEYIDLYLTHWPVANEYIPAYLEMEKLQKEGKIKSIGVCNLKKHHMEDLLSKVNVVPAVNQIEFNPQFQDNEIVDFCKEKGILIEAYSPLGSGACLNNPEIETLAKAKNRSVAQVILRWILQKDILPLPKSVHENRIIENISVFDFELSEEEVVKMNQLNMNERTCADPDNFDF